VDKTRCACRHEDRDSVTLTSGRWTSRCAPHHVGKPVELGAESVAEARRRAPAERAAGERRVGPRPANVACLRVAAVEHDAAPRERLELRDHGGQHRLHAAADVVDRRRTAGDSGAHRRVDGVGDVGEVAGLRAVAVERERRAGEERLAEPPHRHVRALARPEDGEVAQPDRRQPVRAVDLREVLARMLRHAVG
jgi:hypothetical protein